MRRRNATGKPLPPQVFLPSGVKLDKFEGKRIRPGLTVLRLHGTKNGKNKTQNQQGQKEGNTNDDEAEYDKADGQDELCDDPIQDNLAVQVYNGLFILLHHPKDQRNNQSPNRHHIVTKLGKMDKHTPIPVIRRGNNILLNGIPTNLS